MATDRREATDPTVTDSRAALTTDRPDPMGARVTDVPAASTRTAASIRMAEEAESPETSVTIVITVTSPAQRAASAEKLPVRILKRSARKIRDV